MPISRHAFAHLDTDTDPSKKDGSAFDAALNIALEPGYVRPQTGNVAVAYALPAGTNQVVGSCEDNAGGVLDFVCNSNGNHQITRTNLATGTRALLLQWSGLALSTDKPVLGAAVLDGLLVYLDANGDLRSVNLERAEAGYYTAPLLAAEPYCLHLVKVPPGVEKPMVMRAPATGDPRDGLKIIQNKAYQFAVRWRYLDGEVTPLSPYSDWLDVVDNPQTTTSTSIQLTLPAPPAGVTEVEVLVREAGNGGWKVADTLRRTAGLMPPTFGFYGLVTGGAVTDQEAATLFESCWPAEAMCVAKSRVMEANTLEGYPTPEPAFTVVVVPVPAAVNSTQDVYRLTYLHKTGQTRTLYYVLASGTYGDPASRYYRAAASVPPGSYSYTPTQSILYQTAFVDSQSGEADPPDRAVTVLAAQTTLAASPTTTTLHENATYRVTVQFYDALGRPYGCAAPQLAQVPVQTYPTLQRRALLATLTTALSDQNAEIPAGAASYQFLVARNDRATEFRQGVAADTRGFFGNQRTLNNDGSVKETSILKDRNIAHEKLWVDIGNWSAAGQGYVWTPESGDMLRFSEEGQEFLITGQVGDYVEVSWSGKPTADRPRVEIYTPNTAPSDVYYERGPRLPVLRDGAGVRRYAATALTLEGDCFLTPLSFPALVFNTAYNPPDIKEYVAATAPTTVESMVPLHRLVAGLTKLTTVREANVGFDKAIAKAGGPVNVQEFRNARDEVGTKNIAFSGQASGVWLDMGYGGRPGAVVPLALQQVRRPELIRFSGVKVQGNRVNGLGQWDALNQYEELPQEQGAITRLTVADQTQTDGSILLVNQERGDDSLSLGQSQIQTADGQPLISITKSVIGGNNALRGGYGCTDPATVVAYAGKVFYFCRQREEVLRYDRNGLTPLALTYKARQRLSGLLREFAGSVVRGCFDPKRKEYILTFDPPVNFDQQGLSFVYSDRYEAWADGLSAVPEAGQAVGSELVTWKAGALWRHTPDAPQCSFYGVVTPATLTFTAAQPGGVAKQFKDVAVETTGPLWRPTALATDTQLTSRTIGAWFTHREGVYRAGLRRAENTPGFTTIYHALDNGQPLIGSRLTTTLTAPANALPLTACSISFIPRSGQSMGV